MTIDFLTTYPKELTNSAWQKKKTFKEKTTKKIKTGLGAALLAAEEAWKDIPFKTMDAKNFKPKTRYEAELNVDKAKWVTEVKVPKAVAALKTAHTKAQATAKNEALSEAAREAANDMLFKLTNMRYNLKTIKLHDFELAVTKFDAKASGSQALGRVTLFQVRGRPLGNGKKGLRKDKAVTVYEITWAKNLDPQTLVGKKVTVQSSFEDGQNYVNDMTLTRLSNTKNTAFLNQ